MEKKLKIAFLGTPEFSVKILESLKIAKLTPSLIITTPDKPKGRKLVLTPPKTKIWAEENSIEVFQPLKLKDPIFLEKMQKTEWDLFIVASYGKIIPQVLLDIPKYKTINIHPSLLPRLRGASPMQSAILNEKETGVTIMLMDAGMDHGPILMQKKIDILNWPIKINKLETLLAKVSSEMLLEVIPLWIKGKIKPQEQDHTKATYIDKIDKQEAFIDFNDAPEKNYRKILALQNFKPYFFFIKNNKKIRIIIKDAKLEKGKLIITKIIPEGKKEMDYKDFLRGNKK